MNGQTARRKGTKTIGLILPCSWPPKLLVTFDKPEGQQLKRVNFIFFYSMKIRCNLIVLISHQIRLIIIIIRPSSMIILQLRFNLQKILHVFHCLQIKEAYYFDTLGHVSCKHLRVQNFLEFLLIFH